MAPMEPCAHKRLCVAHRRNGNEYLSFRVSSNGFETFREIGPRQWKYLPIDDVSSERDRREVAAFNLKLWASKAQMRDRAEFNLARRNLADPSDPFALLELAQRIGPT